MKLAERGSFRASPPAPPRSQAPSAITQEETARADTTTKETLYKYKNSRIRKGRNDSHTDNWIHGTAQPPPVNPHPYGNRSMAQHTTTQHSPCQSVLILTVTLADCSYCRVTSISGVLVHPGNCPFCNAPLGRSWQAHLAAITPLRFLSAGKLS